MVSSILPLVFAGILAVQARPDALAHFRRQESASGGAQYGNNTSTMNCAAACSQISQLPLNVTFPNTTAYSQDKADYWSTFQADVSPACFVEPSTASDVSSILQIVRDTQCPFAVKSGGHAPLANASNIPDGITILLHQMNELTLSDDQTITRVGTGNTWIDVYEYLSPKNLSVVGGRFPPVGTGGLTLGGGINDFSGRYGWACDGVANYELVVANGTILQVNQESHPDLYFALRGGGNNFGIVTRLDLETFEQGDIWGGFYATAGNTNESLLDALYWYGHRAPEDVDTSVFVIFGFFTGELSANTGLRQTEGIANPPIFENFTSIPPTLSTLRETNVTGLSLELGAGDANGLRQTFQTATFLLTREILTEILRIYVEETEAVQVEKYPSLPAILLQPIPTNMIRQFSRNGGNALGINATQGPLLLINISWNWMDTSFDDEILGVGRRIIERSIARGQEIGADHPYIYQNYAAEWQKPFEGYGEENLERLRGISRTWDPEGIMQTLQPGYFKLF